MRNAAGGVRVLHTAGGQRGWGMVELTKMAMVMVMVMVMVMITQK